MKRKHKDKNRQNLSPEAIENLHRKLGIFHRYHVKQSDTERIFGPPLKVEDLHLDHNHEVFIYNIPSECYEDQLLPMLFKAGPLYMLTILPNYNGNGKAYAFVTYMDMASVNYACDLLSGYEIAIGSKLSITKCTENTKLFIGNIKLEKISFYRIQSKLFNLLHGVKSVTFYSASVYGRYSLTIEFFRYRDAMLAKRALIGDRFFQCCPEIFIDCCFIAGPRTEPAVIYEWENYADSANEHPKVTVLDAAHTQHLQMF